MGPDRGKHDLPGKKRRLRGSVGDRRRRQSFLAEKGSK